MKYIDRNGKPLSVGQRVRAQVCIGRYGQTAAREGIITALGPHAGITLRTERAFNENCGLFGVQLRPAGSEVYLIYPRAGYEKFEDFEHGHETWVEIVD